MERRNIRNFVCLLVLGLVLTCTPAVNLLTNKTAASVILFLETGHVLRLPQSPPAVGVDDPAVPPPTADATAPTAEVDDHIDPEPTEPESVAVFSPSDAALVEVNSYCGYAADVPAWLCRPLSWNLQQSAPTVLILHTHATESYENAKDTNYHTRDKAYNVVSVGDLLATRLEAAGIGVIHDRTLHDDPSYSASYENAREVARAYLEQYPTIRLVLDMHRDSVTDDRGGQVKFTVETSAGTAAQMMLVVGTDASGLSHSKWSENMSLAVKLHALLEKSQPGICRPISFRSQRFNQDLSTGALLLEMGSAGNTRQEALLAAEYLAEAIIDLAKGTA